MARCTHLHATFARKIVWHFDGILFTFYFLYFFRRFCRIWRFARIFFVLFLLIFPRWRWWWWWKVYGLRQWCTMYVFHPTIRLYPKNPNHCNNDNGYACRICEQPSSQFSFSGPYRRMHGKINSFNFRPEHQSFLLSSQNVCSILSFLELIEIQYRCAGCVECCCCSLWLPLSLSTSCWVAYFVGDD